MERKQKIRLAAAPFVLAAFVAPMALASCGNPLAALCCTDFKPGTNMVAIDWGLKGSANAEFGASLQAIGDFSASATAMVSDLGVACKGLAIDLGVDEAATNASNADAKSPDPSKFTNAWCGLAAAKIGDLKASAQLTIDIQPPSCHASVSAKASCEGSCNANVDCTLTPGEITANCTGGEVSGQCSGSCTGHCEGSATVAVTCSGQCSGTCEGTCDGVAGPTGGAQCAGQCGGKCRGDCTADGSATAKCEGSCGGKCDVAFVAPKCSVTVKNPKAECNASAKCEGSCNASASAKAECTPPSVSIKASAGAGFELKIAALQKWLPQIFLIVEGRVVLLNGQITALAKVSGDLQAGLKGDAKAVFCIVPAVAAVATAGENIGATVSAAGTISGKVGG